jgi:DNA-binding NtrC family response regulator
MPTSRASALDSVLFVDCPEAQRRDAELQLGLVGRQVVWASSFAVALAELQRRDMPVLIDCSRGAAAFQIVRELRVQRPTATLFGVADPSRPDLVTEAVLAGVADVLPSPISGHRVDNSIMRERGGPSADAAPGSQVTGLDDLYAYSSAMREVRAAVTRAATTRGGVLVRGESGTGRQVVGRAIHAADGRGRAFVTIDCNAGDGDQLEAQLFGVPARAEENLPARGLERISQSGRLFHALGGTLYIENIEQAPTRVQRRLARLLRDREATVVETSVVVAFDVRCVTGADAGIETAHQDGRVQDDLFRRLAATRIDMPPLRNRREDIPALANRFVRQICASLQVAPKVFSRPALALLVALPWRGNASELEALLHTIVSGLGGRGIALEDVLAHVRLNAGSVMLSQGGTLRQARARFEHEYITAILQQHRGRITQAAKALGIQRTNLYRKMRTLRVPQPRQRGA